MAYKVEFTQQGLNDLNKLSSSAKSYIISWLFRNVENSYNPRNFGYQLEKYNYNYWKYRLGNNRILCNITKEKVVVIAIRNDYC